MKDFDTIFYSMVAQNVVSEHYGRRWVTKNKNRLKLVDSVLDQFTPERRLLGDYKSPLRVGLGNFHMK